MVHEPRTLPDADQELEDINRQLFTIIYALNEKYREEAEFAILKLRTATEDIHRLRITQATKP